MTALNFTYEGAGPTAVFAHSLGCTLQMWDALAATLRSGRTVLRYDQRGHGQSPAADAPFTVDDLADDTAALIEREVGQPVDFVGLSLGGMVAQSLAARHPQWVRSVVIANSSSHYDAAAREQWKTRIDAVRARGLGAISDGVMQRWFTPEFRADEAGGGAATVRATRAAFERCDAASYALTCEAIAQIDFRESNSRITCPVLVIAGERDESTPPAMSQAIAGRVAGARLERIDAAHLSAVEKPREFAALLAAFWQSL